jgi:L-lactate dehydrogenase complex protein LldG
MNAREQILARVRAAASHPATGETLPQRLAARPRASLPPLEADLGARFIARARALSSDVIGPLPAAQAPAAVADYLRSRQLPLRAAAWPGIAALEWSSAGMEVTARPATADDLVGITGAYAGIAETGSLMLHSGADTPAVSSLLPETHVALLPVSRIVARMEDGFALLRHATGDAWPRGLWFVSGPSRTADIEQTITLGAHGPYRVLIVLTT